MNSPIPPGGAAIPAARDRLELGRTPLARPAKMARAESRSAGAA
jgi:hypothetical protein